MTIQTKKYILQIQINQSYRWQMSNLFVFFISCEDLMTYFGLLYVEPAVNIHSNDAFSSLVELLLYGVRNIGPYLKKYDP